MQTKVKEQKFVESTKSGLTCANNGYCSKTLKKTLSENQTKDLSRRPLNKFNKTDYHVECTHKQQTRRHHRVINRLYKLERTHLSLSLHV